MIDFMVKTRIVKKNYSIDLVPRSASYGVCISQLIRFARVFSHVDDFNTRKKALKAISLL